MNNVTGTDSADLKIYFAAGDYISDGWASQTPSGKRAVLHIYVNLGQTKNTTSVVTIEEIKQ